MNYIQYMKPGGNFNSSLWDFNKVDKSKLTPEQIKYAVELYFWRTKDPEMKKQYELWSDYQKRVNASQNADLISNIAAAAELPEVTITMAKPNYIDLIKSGIRNKWTNMSTEDKVHAGIDAATTIGGFIPGVDVVADGADVLHSLQRKDWAGAGIGAAAMVLPFVSAPMLRKIKTLSNTLFFPEARLARSMNKNIRNAKLLPTIVQTMSTTPDNHIRIKVGDVEVNDPNLAYRQIGESVAREFPVTGRQVPSLAESEYGMERALKHTGIVLGKAPFPNPMYAQGHLWYGLPQEGSTMTGLLTTNQPLLYANKSARPVLRKPIITSEDGLVTTAYDPRRGTIVGTRRIPVQGQLNSSNTTAYIYDPKYGYRIINTLQPKTSLAFFERLPAKISEAERLGIPKGDRNQALAIRLLVEANTKKIIDFLNSNRKIVDGHDIYKGSGLVHKLRSFLQQNKVDVSKLSDQDLADLIALRQHALRTQSSSRYVVPSESHVRLYDPGTKEAIGYADFDFLDDMYKIDMISNSTFVPGSTPIKGVSEDIMNFLIQKSIKNGGKGVRSGHDLRTPQATIKIWDKYPDKEILSMTEGSHYWEPYKATPGPIVLLKSPSKLVVPSKSFLFSPNSITSDGQMIIDWNKGLYRKNGGKLNYLNLFK